MASAVAKYPTGVAEPLELPDELYVSGDSPLKLSWLVDEAFSGNCYFEMVIAAACPES